MTISRRTHFSPMVSKVLILCLSVEVTQAFSGVINPRLHRDVSVLVPSPSHRRMRRRTSLAFFQRSTNHDNVVPEEKSATSSDTMFSKDSLQNLFRSEEQVERRDAAATMPNDNGNGGNEKEGYMGDLVKFLRNDKDDTGTSSSMSTTTSSASGLSEEQDQSSSLDQIVSSLGTVAVISSILLALGSTLTGGETGGGDANMAAELSLKVQSFFADPMSALEKVVETVESMGPMGYVYFGAVYTVAEILAIPAIPLTASAGYLFGVRDGTAVVLASASIAAAVSFVIGRTLLRSYVEKLLEDYPDFQKIDKAIGKEGFKLMLLLRISPIFPFALSNYLYGVTSIRFWPFFWGTMLGFTPGTIAYVFAGEIGKSLTIESASAQPWYVYAGVLTLLSGFIKVASDVATGIIEEVQEEEDEDGTIIR